MIANILCCGAVIAAFEAARRLSARLGNPPWASPVLVAALVAGALLALLHVPVAMFVAASLPLRWLLGPALVALALVIDSNRAALRSGAVAVFVAISGGVAVGIGSALGLAKLLGLGPALRSAVAVKTLSTPFAVAIMTSVGGPVALAAALAVVTGVVGAVLVPLMFDALRLKSRAARALGMGVSSHIVGTDWLTRRDASAGGLSALAMVVAGTLAALLLPPACRWIVG